METFEGLKVPPDDTFKQGIKVEDAYNEALGCGDITSNENCKWGPCELCIFSSTNAESRGRYFTTLQKEEKMNDEHYTMYKGLKVPTNMKFRDDCNAVNAAAHIFNCPSVSESVDRSKPGCPGVSCSECIYSRQNAAIRGEYCKFLGHNVNKMPELRTGMVVKIKGSLGERHGLVVDNTLMYFGKQGKDVIIEGYDKLQVIKEGYEVLSVWDNHQSYPQHLLDIINGRVEPIWSKDTAIELTIEAIEEKLIACNVLREGETIKIVKEE